MLIKILNYVLMFFLFSIVGWTVESTYRSLGETYRARKTTKEKKIINSGFLYGPMCPIYGTGGLVFQILLTPFKKYWWAVILLGMVFADIVEYITSVLMEKLFHTRWWDYSDEFLNLHGRICFKHTVYWAVFSVVYVYFLGPLYDYLISFIPQDTRMWMLGVIFAVFILDLFLTVRAVADVQRIVAKVDSLRTNVSLASEYVKAGAAGIRSSALAKYDEFRDTVSGAPERFEEWRADISNQIRSARAQIGGEAGQENAADASAGSRRLQRLFRNYPAVRERAAKAVKDIEDKWDEIKNKFQQ